MIKIKEKVNVYEWEKEYKIKFCAIFQNLYAKNNTITKQTHISIFLDYNDKDKI